MIHVVREEKYPFTADIVNEGDLVPRFIFPWISGTREVACAFSLDREIWYQAATDFEWSGNSSTGQVEFTARIYNDDYDLIPIPADGIVYVKLLVIGSALAGETDIYTLTPSGDGWNMAPYDDSGGDHGGGGQGSHDRPGKDDPDETPTPTSTPTPTPTPTSTPSPIPTEALPPAQTGTPEALPPPDPTPPPSDGPILTGSFGSSQGTPAPKPSPSVAPPSPEASAQSSPLPSQSPSPAPMAKPTAAPTAPPAPSSDPGTTAPHVPGFVVAGAATSAVLLGGGLWLHGRKRK